MTRMCFFLSLLMLTHDNTLWDVFWDIPTSLLHVCYLYRDKVFFLTSLMLTDANLLSGVFGDIHCYSNISANILWIMYLFFSWQMLMLLLHVCYVMGIQCFLALCMLTDAKLLLGVFWDIPTSPLPLCLMGIKCFLALLMLTLLLHLCLRYDDKVFYSFMYATRC